LSYRIFIDCEKKFVIGDDGVISVGDTSGYENLLQNDNDIPNLAYINSLVFSGYSGFGQSGFSGFSGLGYSGDSGTSGVSGASTSGFSGVSGASTSGFSGVSGASTSGFSGVSGSSTSGFSGVSGSSTSGFSGVSGASTSGWSGYSGPTGIQTGYRASPSATKIVPTVTTVKITMDTVTYDVNSEHDAVNGRWLCKNSGKYRVTGQCYFTAGATGYRLVYLYKNATTTGDPPIYNNGTGTNIGLGILVPPTSVALYPLAVAEVNLTAGDYVELFVRHSQGSNLTCGDVTNPVSWLAIERIDGIGLSGWSGWSGYGESGWSGWSGASTSGFSGVSGASTSGFSGISGASTSGFSGVSGATSTSGYSGWSGVAGNTGSVEGAWPVGSVFIGVVSTSPATLLGFGTWARIAEGQFLIGQKSADTDFDTAEETGGNKTLYMSHTHQVDAPNTASASGGVAHTHDVDVGATTSGGPSAQIAMTQDAEFQISWAYVATNTHTHSTDPASVTSGAASAAGHTHDVDIASFTSGSSGWSGSIMNPYFVVYLWKRTA
jgi:hypothetical protein